MRIIIRVVIALVIVGGLAYSVWAYWEKNQAPAVTFRTAPVKRGELLATISATGTVEPEEVVDIGAQVAGQILSFGEDPHAPGKEIDYNTQVEEGTVLARIDDALYAADEASANAARESAKASVARAEADVNQYKAKMVQADRDWKRAQEAAKGVMSEADYDAFQAAYETAKANVAVGQAALLQAQKSVVQADANLLRATRNHEYCVIKSPVKGVIIDRRVNKGQTVVSSLNAPSLFLIAKDLSRIQVWASVNEADISNIHPGQTATFTVDAEPSRVFKGVVEKVRMSANVTQNVVTYPVEINADNSDKALRPYETANVQFEVERKPDALLVPNVALRWSPTSPLMVAPDAREAYVAQMSGGGRGAGGGGGAPRAAATSQGAGDGATAKASGARGPRAGGPRDPSQSRGTVWIQEGAFVKPVRIKTGRTDTTYTAVLSDELKEGDLVVTGEVRTDSGAADDAKNPFMPQFNRSSGGGGGRRGGG